MANEARQAAPADAGVRRAVLHPARSFIVQAPAGSGKTELLIQRYLTLLARVDEPEAIAAITFTRKAAGEMRLRVLSALEKAARGTPPESVHERETLELAEAALRHGPVAPVEPARKPVAHSHPDHRFDLQLHRRAHALAFAPGWDAGIRRRRHRAVS